MSKHIRVNNETWKKIKFIAALRGITQGQLIEEFADTYLLNNQLTTPCIIKQKTEEEILPEPLLELKITNYEKVKANLTMRQHLETWINIFNEFRNKKLPQEQRLRLEQILNELVERYKNVSQ